MTKLAKLIIRGQNLCPRIMGFALYIVMTAFHIDDTIIHIIIVFLFEVCLRHHYSSRKKK